MFPNSKRQNNPVLHFLMRIRGSCFDLRFFHKFSGKALIVKIYFLLAAASMWWNERSLKSNHVLLNNGKLMLPIFFQQCLCSLFTEILRNEKSPPFTSLACSTFSEGVKKKKNVEKGVQEKWPALLVTKGTETSLIDLRPCFSLLPKTVKVQQSITFLEAKFSLRPILFSCWGINCLSLLHTSLMEYKGLKMGITWNLWAFWDNVWVWFVENALQK